MSKSPTVGGSDVQYAPLGTGKFTGLYLFDPQGITHFQRKRIRNPFLAWALEARSRGSWTGFMRGVYRNHQRILREQNGGRS